MTVSGLEIGVLAGGAVLLLSALLGGLIQLGKMPRVLIGVAGVAALGYAAWLVYGPVVMARHFEQVANDAFVACHVPADPAKVPDGNAASKDEMIAAQKAARAFDSQTTAYVACLDLTGTNLKRQYSATLPQAEIMKMEDERVRLHNAAIDKDQAQANGFNVQLRLFKARIAGG
jgi:hypothetical protein